MKNIKLKTNIKCGGCISTITPHLDNLKELKSWHVDTQNPDKIIDAEIEENAENLLIETIQKAGFKAEII